MAESPNWVALLLVPSVRSRFLEGVYSLPESKAAFKCAHIAEQLRDCASSPSSTAEHDAKVCEILRWEQTLCWSRYVAADHFASVRECYTNNQSGQSRAKCDPLITKLQARVTAVRDSLAAESVTRPELRACPRFDFDTS